MMRTCISGAHQIDGAAPGIQLKRQGHQPRPVIRTDGNPTLVRHAGQNGLEFGQVIRRDEAELFEGDGPAQCRRTTDHGFGDLTRNRQEIIALADFPQHART